MLFFLRDHALNRLLQDCQLRVARAQSTADLLDVLDRLEVFPGELEFDHAQSILLLVVAFASLVVALLMDGMGGMVWVAVACCIFSYYVKKGLSGSLTELSASIARKCALFSNGLSEPDSSADWCLTKLDSQFGDYRRGNERRHIVASAQGVYQGTRHSLAFEYHHLLYVNAVSERGASGYRTSYKSFDRYSLVLEFPWLKGISVQSDPLEMPLAGQRFKTDCDEFDRAFLLRSSDQARFESFATPATLSLLLDLSRLLNKVNLEFSSEGRLCLSFDNAEVFAHADPGPLSDLAAFRQRMIEGIALPGLNPVLERMHRLAELHDHPLDHLLAVTEKVAL